MQGNSQHHGMISQAPSHLAKYTIYAYDKYCEHTIGHNKWQCLLSGHDQQAVMRQAEHFYSSDQFQKIEVKKKFFDSRKNRHQVTTVKVLDGAKPKNSKFKNNLTILSLSLLGLLSLGLFLIEKM